MRWKVIAAGTDISRPAACEHVLRHRLDDAHVSVISMPNGWGPAHTVASGWRDDTLMVHQFVPGGVLGFALIEREKVPALRSRSDDGAERAG
jgi:hypothetical protein